MPASEGTIPRRRVQRVLQGRFDRRVTVLQAGAGFGKTTALANALAENALLPRGRDVWLACEPDDADAAHLLAGLSECLGLGSTGDLEAIAASLSARSPSAVCLVLDDVHHIPDGSSGAATLAAAVEEFPGNASLLLASRIDPPLPLARLEAQGQVGRVGERDLALTDAEIRELAGGVDDADGVFDLGGWPALVSLGLQTRNPAAFLDEEVLASLDGDQRRALDLVVTIGGADGELAKTLLGSTAVTTLRSLPLVSEAGGWFVAHDLWGTVVVEPEGAAALRRAATDHLLDRGDAGHALDLALDHPDDVDVDRILRAAGVPGWHVHPDRRRRWLDRLPAERRRSGAADYLAATVERDRDAGSSEARDLFARAAERFRSEGDGAGEAHAAASAAVTSYIRRESDGLVAPGLRLMELAAEGVDDAVSFAAMATAIYQLGQDEPDATLQTIAGIDITALQGPFRPMADWMIAQAQLNAGHPAIDAARRCVAEVLPLPGMVDVLLSALWREGHLHEAADLLTQPPPRGERHRYLHFVWGALVHGALGDADGRARALAGAKERQQMSDQQSTAVVLALAEVALDIEDGDPDPEARYRALLDAYPISPETRPWYAAAAGMLARWVPDAADAIGRGPDGEIIRRDLRTGEILRRIDGGDVAAIEAFVWPSNPGAVIAGVMLKGACELVAAGWAAGSPDARRTADWLAERIGEPARAHFHELAASHPVAKVRSGATDIVARTPVAPARHRQLQLLGPARLLLDGVAIEDAGWRREKVRALIGFLVLHPDSTRDAAMVALWPDADEESGRRNLRSTLNLLHKVLEPNRESGDATFFVRADAARLRLVRSPRLTIDAWDFEELLDDAAALQRDGVPSLALAPLTEAVELYRGDFLADAAYDDWSLAERDRLRSRFVDAACRTAELRLAGDDLDGAVAMATRALTVEPWSERAHRCSIAAHLARGDRAGARRAVEACVEALADFGGPADTETAMLFRRVRD
ncbi:MAG: BTAD domain-containing putative transcriptional regulator [Actinomycetota bacterium]